MQVLGPDDLSKAEGDKMCQISAFAMVFLGTSGSRQRVDKK